MLCLSVGFNLQRRGEVYLFCLPQDVIHSLLESEINGFKHEKTSYYKKDQCKEYVKSCFLKIRVHKKLELTSCNVSAFLVGMDINTILTFIDIN